MLLAINKLFNLNRRIKMEIVLVLLVVAVAAWWWITRDKKEMSTLVAPYKAETPKAEEVMPVGTEAVMVTPNAVVPAAILEQAPAVEEAPKKPARKPAAPKKPAAAPAKAPAKKPVAKKAKAAPSSKKV
jgi:type IV secretory pathway VirB10-like protein